MKEAATRWFSSPALWTYTSTPTTTTTCCSVVAWGCWRSGPDNQMEEDLRLGEAQRRALIGWAQSR